MFKNIALFLLLPLMGMCGHVIVIDAGHGGFDEGAVTESVKEKVCALSTATYAQEHLTHMGYTVVMTRTRDVFVPLKQRALLANEKNAKLFVSIHFNAAKSPQASGIEIFYYKRGNKWRSDRSIKLAKATLSRLVANTGARSRGVKDGNFLVIRETNMPAILIEGGFITNPNERNLLREQAYLKKMGKAVAEGIDRYFKT